MHTPYYKIHEVSRHALTSISLMTRNTDNKGHEEFSKPYSSRREKSKLILTYGITHSDTNTNPKVTNRYFTLRPNRTLCDAYQNLGCILLLAILDISENKLLRKMLQKDLEMP